MCLQRTHPTSFHSLNTSIFRLTFKELYCLLDRVVNSINNFVEIPFRFTITMSAVSVELSSYRDQHFKVNRNWNSVS